MCSWFFSFFQMTLDRQISFLFLFFPPICCWAFLEWKVLWGFLHILASGVIILERPYLEIIPLSLSYLPFLGCCEWDKVHTFFRVLLLLLEDGWAEWILHTIEWELGLPRVSIGVDATWRSGVFFSWRGLKVEEELYCGSLDAPELQSPLSFYPKSG